MEVRIQYMNIIRQRDGGEDTVHEYYKTEGMEDRIQYMNILRQ